MIYLDVPLIQTHDDWLSAAECQRILSLDLRLSEARVLYDSHDVPVKSNVRRALTHRFHSDTPKEVLDIENRVAEFLRVPQRDFLEPGIFTKYRTGDFFKPHVDQSSSREKFGSVRTDTFIVYLNDDFEGGETFFPNYSISIKPKSGMALHFKYGYPDQRLNQTMIHSGNKVTAGIKYILTFFVRDGSFTKEHRKQVFY